MIGGGTDCFLRCVMLAVALGGLLPGCATIGAQLGQRPCRAVSAEEQRCQVSEPIRSDLELQDRGGSEEAMLAAVEEFLERTNDYRGSSSEGASPISSIPRLTRLTRTTPRSASPIAAERSSTPAPTVLEGVRISPLPKGVVANTHVTLTDASSDGPRVALPLLEFVSIRTAIEPDLGPQEPPQSSTSNQPLGVQPVETVVSTERFVEQLEVRADEDSDFDSLWKVNLVKAALDRLTVPDKVSGLSADAQRMLTGLVRLIVSARAVARNPQSTAKDALERVEELREVIVDRVDPEIPTVALCRSVVTFGVYDEMESHEFVAGRTLRTIVYCEIDHLSAERTADGQYRTFVGTRLEVLSEDGKSVWEHEEPEIEDVCRRRRSDFFIAQRIALPPLLSEGEYVLKAFVEDKLSGKANESTYRFFVQSPMSIATR
ncbi:MAG: hypothetical protein JSU63_01960 [Phycisphaerales bacterium]|nr:MAG: hypothetical protein JSU63_01960 [Phycisphaerales bacterium]